MLVCRRNGWVEEKWSVAASGLNKPLLFGYSGKVSDGMDRGLAMLKLFYTS